MYRRYIGKEIRITQVFKTKDGDTFFIFNGKMINGNANTTTIIDRKTNEPHTFQNVFICDVAELNEKQINNLNNKFDSYWTWTDKIDKIISEDIKKTNEKVLKGFGIKGGENNAKETAEKGKA